MRALSVAGKGIRYLFSTRHIVTAMLGYCGLIYEFVFAQSLSVLFGHSLLQYSLTIGLFLAGMGIGSHISEYLTDARSALWRVQLKLCILAPFAVLALWWVALSGWAIPARILAFSVILGVGVLTGMELPLLMRLNSGPTSTSAGTLLAADYAGMLIACFLFPLFLLPYTGVFVALFSTAVINVAALALVMPRRSYLALPLGAALSSALYFEPVMREWLSLQMVTG